ncbi:MAG: hypothetical protein WCE63_07060, partial [Acidobacteriaceae bacterium]
PRHLRAAATRTTINDWNGIFTHAFSQSSSKPHGKNGLARRDTLNLPDRDLDTGNLVRPGGYRLTDKTYAELLNRLTSKPARHVPSGLRRDVLAYYADPNAPISTRKNSKAWKRVQTELTTLEGMQTVGNKNVAMLRR